MGGRVKMGNGRGWWRKARGEGMNAKERTGRTDWRRCRARERGRAARGIRGTQRRPRNHSSFRGFGATARRWVHRWTGRNNGETHLFRAPVARTHAHTLFPSVERTCVTPVAHKRAWNAGSESQSCVEACLGCRGKKRGERRAGVGQRVNTGQWERNDGPSGERETRGRDHSEKRTRGRMRGRKVAGHGTRSLGSYCHGGRAKKRKNGRNRCAGHVAKSNVSKVHVANKGPET